MPEVEIDIDDLLEVTSDDERASKLQVPPVCVDGFSFITSPPPVQAYSVKVLHVPKNTLPW